ncbi:MAG TPA: hypothetical protein VGR16_05595, partial [Thermomicrobiales bacterium]|nr:hypothetical protein [Thermomicrobiales bacterium]
MSELNETVATKRRQIEEQLRRASINRRALLKGAAGFGAGAAALGSDFTRRLPVAGAQDATNPDPE